MLKFAYHAMPAMLLTSQKTSSTSDQGSKPTLCRLAMCLQTHCILRTLTQTLL